MPLAALERQSDGRLLRRRRAAAAGLRGHPVERFGIVSLSAIHRAFRTGIVSTGTLDASLVHPRVFRNHPSGDPTLSERRRRRRDRAAAAGRTLMGIEVLYHVILADNPLLQLQGDGTPVIGIARRSDRLPR